MELKKYVLQNSSGMVVEFLNFGGIVTKINIPENVVLGLSDEKEYIRHNPPYFGAIIGRVANRIAGASFAIDGDRFRLYENDGPSSLHGGKTGFDKVFWNVREITPQRKYELSYLSPDGEEGYPGNLNVKVTYSLDEENAFTIDYLATTDKPTHVNLTQHSYFNLSGNPRSTILDHELRILSDKYTPSDSAWIPTGEVRRVEKAIDFTAFKKIGAHISELPYGYNHNYVLENHGVKKLAAVLRHPASRRKLEVLTTQPGLQVYSGHYLEIPSSGIALEAQHYPDSPHHPDFPSTLLSPQETYSHSTTYRFSDM